MKKYLIGIASFFLIWGYLAIGSVDAFEAVSDVSFGAVKQKDATTEFGYSVGFDAALKTWDASGAALTGGLSYVYSKFGDEIQVLRVEASIQKTLLVSTFRWYASLGAVEWSFLNTGGDDETFGGFTAGTGVVWKAVDLSLGIDVVQSSGDNIIYPFVGFALGI